MSALSKGFSSAARAPHSEKAGASLLVVDDESSVTESIADLFRREYPVITATSADEGFATLLDNDVAVVISDQRMPGHTGAELLARVAEFDPSITRILLTGYADIAAVIQAVNIGKIYSYVTKPWRPDDLQFVVDKAFEHNGLLREREQLVNQLRAANTNLEDQVAARTRELQARSDALEEANRVISELARTDPLTGLFNRRHLDEAFAREAERAMRQSRPLSVVMADIDHFKQVNDTHGHAVGDAVLKVVASTLTAHIRTYDLAARFGGEEFVVLLPDTSLGEAVVAAERFRVAIELASIDGYPGTITASFGVASLESGQDPVELLANADGALYHAKANGRNRVETYHV